jgi:hypothetical protein
MLHVLTICLLNEESFDSKYETIHNLPVDNFHLRNHIEISLLFCSYRLFYGKVLHRTAKLMKMLTVSKLYKVTNGWTNRTALLIPSSELQDRSDFSVFILFKFQCFLDLIKRPLNESVSHI